MVELQELLARLAQQDRASTPGYDAIWRTVVEQRALRRIPHSVDLESGETTGKVPEYHHPLFHFDFEGQEIFSADKSRRVVLQAAQATVLQTLVESADEPVGIEALVTAINPTYNASEERNRNQAQVYISRLRIILNGIGANYVDEKGNTKSIIETVSIGGVGYRLINAKLPPQLRGTNPNL